MLIELSDVKQFARNHWDTALLFVAATAFFIQVTGSFWQPHTTPLASHPQPAPAPVFLMLNQAHEKFEPVTDTLAADLKSDSQPKKSFKHYPKKVKPVLKPASISINKASVAQLDQLPGVGPKLAERIVDYRKGNGLFAALEDLKNVKGIGKKNFAKMQVYLTL